jgi:Tfp pilus assembly protein PilN
MNGVNLIPAYRVAARKQRGRLRLWGAIGAGYAMAVAVVYLWMAAAWGGRSHDQRSHLAAVETRLADSNRALKARQASLAEAEANHRANELVGEQPDWSMLLGLLGRTVGQEVVLEQVALRPPDPNSKVYQPPVLALNGLGRTHGAVTGFVLRLEETKVFSKVTIQETKRTATPATEAISFRVEAVIALGGEGTP